MGRIKYLAAILLAIVWLVVPRPAHAVPGMCTINGTVYGLNAAPLANGSVVFRSMFTQTFSNDTVAATPEYVTLDGSGNLPAGTQVPLGSRIIITVQGDPQPHPVTVTTNPANCPLAFGALIGASSGVIVPSTVVTSINTTNNFPGITLTAQNPVAAGPATLTLSNSGLMAGYNTTAGTWTPSLQFGGASTGITYSSNVGLFSISGKIATWQFTIILTNAGTATGNAAVTGLPVAMTSNVSANQGGVCNIVGNMASLTNFVPYPAMGGNVTTIGLNAWSVASNAASVNMTNANFTNTSNLQCTMTYIIN